MMCVLRQKILRCARNLYRTLFITYILLQMAQCVTWADIVDDTAILARSVLNITSTTKTTLHEPKFGERLLPLRKDIVNFRVNIGYKKSAITAKTITNLPRTIHVNNNRNNYVVIQENDVATQNPDDIINVTYNKYNNNNNNNNNKYNNNNNNINNNNNNNKYNNNNNDNYEVGNRRYNRTSDTYALAAASTIELSNENLTVETIPIITTLITNERQGKQFNRRQDINAEYEYGNLSADRLSKADRLVEMSTEFFIVPTNSASMSHSLPVSTQIISKGRGLHNFLQPTVHSPTISPRSVLIVSSKNGVIGGNESITPPTIISTHPRFTGLRKEPWVIPVLVLAAVTMFMMSAFEIFVLFKAWRTSPSRRHVFLGQMLLLGLFACAVLGAIITSQPSLMSCGTIRFGVGVAYALVFAALLVKCVFLISLNGGVYLPAPYLGLLLLFAVLIQVAIGVQWLITHPPEIYTQSVSTSIKIPHSERSISSNIATIFQSTISTNNGGYLSVPSAGSMLISLCKTEFSEFLFSLTYVLFLIIFITILAIKSRGIRDNYREAPYIGLAIGGIMPIWLGWILCGLMVADRHSDACIAFGLVATSATVFLVMFMPKGRQLAALGKEGLYIEDREEQFSSISRGGSGYSPSFFHFKPLKYGVMGGFQNSTTTTTNNNNNNNNNTNYNNNNNNINNIGVNTKHSSNVVNSGDRFALITAATPTYTRMYHYFPSHLTAHTPYCFYPPLPPPLPPLPPLPSSQSPPQQPQTLLSNITQLPAPPTLKHLGTTLSSMPPQSSLHQAHSAHSARPAHIAPTLRYPGLMMRSDDTNVYTTLEPTLSSNPNVYFQRGGAVHPGMMY